MSEFISSEQSSAVDAMAVSFSKVDITPPVGTLLAGYDVATPRTATGVHEPLWARCTVFWDSGYPNVIVTADVLAYGPGFNQTVRGQIQALGVANSDFVLTCTHTHNGPVLTEPINPYILYGAGPDQQGAIQAYTNQLITKIVGLVATTLAATRTACRLDYRVTQASFAYNREGLSYVERDVPVLVARSLAGAPLAVLFGYGCHPVAAGSQSQFDPDYPGEAVSLIEQDANCFAQFVIGPAGDQDPAGQRGWDLRDTLGETLGQAVINSMNVAGRAVTGPITTAYRDITLPLDITDQPANLAVVRSDYDTRMHSAGLSNFVGRHAKTMIAEIDAHSFSTTVPIPLQVWKLAGSPTLRLVFTGGELVSGYAVYYRNRYGGSNGIWITGYGNDVPVYIPSDELLYIHPGAYYACGWTPDFPGIAGGSMCTYGWLGHFLGRRPGTTTNGVEQIMISQLDAML